MQAMSSVRVANTPMTLPLACLFSEAFAYPSISTGKERDVESGNDYFGGRYYAPTMGRFLSPDYADDDDGPVSIPCYNPSNPQSLNLYSYAGNNPLIGTDEDGHDYYLLGGSQCGQNGVNCDQQGYVLGADGNRAVVTDAQLANGQYGANFDSNGNLTSITTGQGTFGAQFFDASPNAVSATVYADPRISGFSQNLIGQINAYDQGAKPLMDVLALNAAAGMGVTALGELTLEGGMTTMDLAPDLTEHAESLMARHGISPQQARDAIQAAKKSGDVVKGMGRYGPQLRYTANGIRVVVAETGRNAGRIITAFWR
jgi:RHS repeat-associated protein